MRLSAISALALPLLAASQENPLDQIKAQAQHYFDLVSSYIPSPNKAHTDVAAHAAAAKVGGKALHILTLNDWKDTILDSVKPANSNPEEWWVLVTGGNKTCFGHCGKVETAFNETAALFSANANAPHLAYLNCDNQPVLCNSWGAGPPSLWVMHVQPPVFDVRVLSVNLTTTTTKTFTEIHSTKSWKEAPLYEGTFHPFSGVLATYGLAVPVGYLLWGFAVIPSWAFMIGVSFISRSIMSKRMAPNPPRTQGGAAAAAPRARVGAPPGDGISYGTKH